MRIAFVFATIAACGTLRPAPDDIADDGGAPAANEGGTSAEFCAAHAGEYFFCADFEQGTIAPFVASDERQDRGGTLAVVAEDGRHFLRASLPQCDCNGQGVLVVFDRAMTEFSGVQRLRVDMDVRFTAAFPTPGAGMSILGVVTSGTSPFTANVYLDANGLQISLQTPGFSGARGSSTIPPGEWTSVRMDVDFGGNSTISIAPRGQEPVLVATKPAAPTGTPTAPMQIFVGIQRYNDATGPLVVDYDHVAVKTLPPQ
jgi:hypothetical protein